MRTLYFDLDGTLLATDTGEVKSRLAGGAFEAAVRRAGFERLVCVGNFGKVVLHVREVKPGYDGVAVLFALCGGAFQELAWFREVTSMLFDPEDRGLRIDPAVDWWYVDDLARAYLHKAGRDDLFERESGRRILAPDPVGDGADVLAWLARIPTRPFTAAAGRAILESPRGHGRRP